MSRIAIPSLAEAPAETHSTLKGVTKRLGWQFLFTNFLNNIAQVELDFPDDVPALRNYIRENRHVED